MSRKLLKSTALVSGMTMISRVLGLVRDIVLARYFGAGGMMDAFVIAFKIPNFLRRLFAEGAFSQAFVPVLSEVKTQNGQAEVKQLTDAVAGTLALILLAVTVIGVVAAPLLIMIFAPGYLDEPERFDLASALLRITFPYILFISLTAFAGGILNTYGRFAVPAFTPVFLNLCLICAAIWFSPQLEQPVFALAWGVFFAGVVQLLFQIPALLKLGLLPKPKWGWHDSGVRKVLKLMIPTLFGASVAQINLLLDLVIASFIAVGSLSWLYYADRLMEFPLGVFGIALATVILPGLSKQHAAEDRKAFQKTLDWALRMVLLIGVPASVGMLMLAVPMLSVLFLRGEFTFADAQLSGVALMAYSFGLVGFMLVKVLVNGYFAQQDTKTPVKIGLVAMGANMVFNLLFVGGMVLAEFDAPHAGLALATSGSSLLNAFLLYRGLRKRDVYSPQDGWLRWGGQIVLATSVMALFLYFFAPEIQFWNETALWEQLPILIGLIGGAIVLYFAMLLLAGMRLRDLRYSHSATFNT